MKSVYKSVNYLVLNILWDLRWMDHVFKFWADGDITLSQLWRSIGINNWYYIWDRIIVPIEAIQHLVSIRDSLQEDIKNEIY